MKENKQVKSVRVRESDLAKIKAKYGSLQKFLDEKIDELRPVNKYKKAIQQITKVVKSLD